MVFKWIYKGGQRVYTKIKNFFWGKKKTKTKVAPEVIKVTEKSKDEELHVDGISQNKDKKQKKKKTPTMNREDVRSIITLYDKVDGDNWKCKENWRSTLPVKQWFGVVVVESRITELCLSANSLKGIIPPEIGVLLGLRKLELDENSLSGEIPATISKLVNLEYLDLSHNNFIGEIPSTLFTIPTLKNVYLQRNHLTGNLPKTMASNPSIEILNLEHNRFNGEPPFEWINKSTLKELHLHGNCFLDNSLARTRLTCEFGDQCEVSV